jgi:hypothetical protein
MRGTWQTTDGGGGTIALVIGAAVLAAAIAGPVAAAAAAVAEALIITIAVLGGLAAVAGTALVAYRLRQGRANRTTPVSFPRPVPRRPVQALPGPERPAIGRPAEVHLHFHGVTAEEVAAILAEHGR